MEQEPPAQRGVRTSEARVLRLLPRESERSGAQVRCTRKPPREVRASAATWEHGLTQQKGRLLAPAVPFQSAWIECRQRGAARARRKCACCAFSQERERARVCAFFTCAHAQVSCSFGGRGSHVGARPCAEGDGRPAGAVGFRSARSESRQRGAARTLRKRACCASSKERANAVARKDGARVSHLKE